MHPALPSIPEDQILFNAYHNSVRRLCNLLQDPAEPSPEARARRDHAVIARIAALVPASPDEVELGANYIVASDYAEQCLRDAKTLTNSPERKRLLIAQATSLMRESRGYRSLLMRVQAARQKREATQAGRDAADWAEHCALGLLRSALHDPPPPTVISPDAEPEGPSEPEPPAALPDAAVLPTQPSAALPDAAVLPTQPSAALPPQPAADPPQASPTTAPLLPPRASDPPPAPLPTDVLPPALPAAAPPPRQPTAQPAPPAAGDDWPQPDWPQPDWAVEAEQYAIIYPRRARLIRSLGRLPPDCDFGPPEPALVQAIVTGTSPALRAVDQPATTAA